MLYHSTGCVNGEIVMKFKVGVTIRLELEVDATTEQDAIITAMNETEKAVDGMKIRQHWYEYVKEVKDGKVSNDS